MPSLYAPESHLRLDLRDDGDIVVSLTRHLVTLLGTPMCLEYLVDEGGEISAGVPFGSVESAKASFDVVLPFAATFVAGNSAAQGNPELLGLGPDRAGWFCTVRPASDAWRDGLLDEAGYAAFIAP